jgi:hypothetical protein
MIRAVLALLAASALVCGADAAMAQVYASELVRQAMAQHRDLAGLSLYATPANGAAAVVAASRGAADDLNPAVVKSAAGETQVRRIGGATQIVGPLRNVMNQPVGVIAVTFATASGSDGALRGRAAAVGRQLASRINNAGNLFEPYPYVAGVSDQIRAQALLMQTLRRHRDVLVLAMHVIPPGKTDGVIIACNVGRIGMASDEADLAVIKTGKPELKVRPDSGRFKVQLPLNDARGVTVAALSVFYAYRAGDKPDAFLARATALRNEVARRIPDKAALFEPANPIAFASSEPSLLRSESNLRRRF